MTRKNALLQLKHDAWFGKLFAKLKQEELSYAITFCTLGESVEFNEFVSTINRMFANCPKGPPFKNWAIVQDLVMAATLNARDKEAK